MDAVKPSSGQKVVRTPPAGSDTRMVAAGKRRKTLVAQVVKKDFHLIDGALLQQTAKGLCGAFPLSAHHQNDRQCGNISFNLVLVG